MRKPVSSIILAWATRHTLLAPVLQHHFQKVCIALLQVQEKLPWFLKAVPSAECAKGGVGGYNNALRMDSADFTGIAGLTDGKVAASSFRTYYVPLNTQQDFINAYQVRKLSRRCVCCCPILGCLYRQRLLLSRLTV